MRCLIYSDCFKGHMTWQWCAPWGRCHIRTVWQQFGLTNRGNAVWVIDLAALIRQAWYFVGWAKPGTHHNRRSLQLPIVQAGIHISLQNAVAQHSSQFNSFLSMLQTITWTLQQSLMAQCLQCHLYMLNKRSSHIIPLPDDQITKSGWYFNALIVAARSLNIDEWSLKFICWCCMEYGV